jgi:hypothetical protein
VDGFGSAGGSLALAELIDEHGSALVADFQAHYGLRLADVLFEWSPREVFALVEGYRTTACSPHHQGGDDWREFLGWGKDRHMAADQWDLGAAHAMSGEEEAAHVPAAGREEVPGCVAVCR